MITLDVETGAGSRRVDLLSLLDHDAAERAHEEAYAWIKAIRHLRVDGVPFRRRFTLRGDSLWWFAELYLHKEQAILQVFRAIARPRCATCRGAIPVSWPRRQRYAGSLTPDRRGRATRPRIS